MNATETYPEVAQVFGRDHKLQWGRRVNATETAPTLVRPVLLWPCFNGAVA